MLTKAKSRVAFRAIVGLGSDSSGERLITLLRRLNIAGLHVTLAGMFDVNKTGRNSQTQLQQAYDAAASHFAGLTTLLAKKSLIETIVEEDKQASIDLVVLEKPSLAEIQELIINSNCSLLLHTNSRLETPKGRMNIVVAYDRSPHGLKVMQKFIDFAPQGVNRVDFISVLTQMLPSAERDFWLGVEIELANVWSHCTFTEIRGDINFELVDKVNESRPDLVVIGSQGENFAGINALGKTAKHILKNSDASILIIKAS